MNIPNPESLYVYHSVIDLRKSYLGLCELVEKELNKDARNGSGYVFINRGKSLAKVLWWDRTGWCLLLKKLSVGRYRVGNSKKLVELKLGEQRYFFDGM